MNTTTVTTRRFVALGHDFAVETLPSLAEHIDRVFSALAAEGEPQHRYTLTRGVRDQSHSWLLAFDGEQISRSSSASFIYSYLCWHVNQVAVTECTDHLLLHASCATHEGRAVLLPAAMESGKTTTVAGLVRSGFQYVTDEATAIDPSTGSISVYAKPLSVDRGSWDVLADLRPDVDADLEIFLGSQWQVPGDFLGRVAEHPIRPALVVTPGYDSSIAGAQFESMTPGETLMTLTSNAFNLTTHGRDGFDRLADLARNCPGYRMRHGDLDAAVRGITDRMREVLA